MFYVPSRPLIVVIDFRWKKLSLDIIDTGWQYKAQKKAQSKL